ncbi:MAG TPA: DUF1684 domain-containing protein [Aquaticitalea sp.]|nr:DUF1684 domain-containing protein [Aquaticitalea sp.]HNU58549.1 DUF1684 domain-containing protein [Aquaticitalea sp.]
MKTVLSSLTLLFFLFGCAQKKQDLMGETDFQRALNAEYKDASKSPLKEKDLKDFKGLDFFNFDSAYVVKARFVRTVDEKPFKMKTTTDRLPEYVKYGEIYFDLNSKPFRLNVYQNQDLIQKSGYEDYLFLPFLDDSNGEETYGGGRYIDLNIPDGDTIVIDFNSAYNPYCAYNEKYSCPIVPRENYLETEVRAGVKKFKKH